MPISQKAQCLAKRRQGSRRIDMAELRRLLARPSDLDDGHRQRLLDLSRRLARVQALGNGYARVTFSEHAAAALGHVTTAV